MAPDLVFGPLVKAHRRERGLTQDELARRVGCAPITLRKIEADDLRPSVQIAERLAIALGLPNENRQAFVQLGRAVQPAPTAPGARRSRRGDHGSEDLAGRTVRGYVLGSRLGQGGMGIVYRAMQPDIAREVAIKVVQPQYADHPEFIRRFESEAQLIARLEHPHIVPLYDFWREPQAAYLVMRLLRGGSVAQWLDQGPLSLAATHRLIEQIVGALSVAHRAGVVHRDLKPANILLDEGGNAYLADFGIARDLGASDGVDREAMAVDEGHAAHTSPEQIRSDPVGPQTDVYGLGVLMYELLTGRTPFSGPTPLDTLHQHLTTDLPPLAAHRPGLPAALDGVIAGATAKNPTERYPSVDDLLEAWRRAATGEVVRVTSQPSVRALTAADNPYKGLRAFEGADAGDFFGREALIQQLLVRLSEGGELARFLAVVGPSGSGKSSVVNAGLLPALRRGGLPGSDHWFVVQMTPGSHPYESLAAVLERVAVNPVSDLIATLKESPRGWMVAVEQCLPVDRTVQLFLVVDQFEELFTQVESEAERAAWLTALVTAVLDDTSRLRIVATLRADLTDRPLGYIDFGELLRQRSEFVLPLTPDELERVIVGPADRTGLTLEPGLAATLIREVVDQPGALPLLQYALTRLFDDRDGVVLTHRAYQAMGGVSGAVTQHAETVYAGLDLAAQVAARQVFLRLVTPGDGADLMRRKVLRHDIEGLESAETANRTAQVLDAFGQARLLSFDRDPATRAPTVELAHEALLQVWPRLRAWLEEGRIDIQTQRLLAQAAGEWESAKRDPGFLLAGSRLAQYESWLATTRMALTPLERALIETSRREHDRLQQQEEARRVRVAALQGRTRRVLQALVGVLLVATLVVGGLAWWANTERQSALRQAAARLAQQAESELAFGKADRSVLLALAALEQYPYTARAEHALAQAVTYSRAERLMVGHVSRVLSAAWSPDGRRLASSGEDRTLRIWEVGSGRPLAQIELDQAAQAMAWAPDGQAVYFTAGTRYETHMHRTGVVSVNVWYLNAAEPEALFVRDDTDIAPEYRNNDFYTTNVVTYESLALSPAGDRLAVIGGDNTVLVATLPDPTTLTPLHGHSSFFRVSPGLRMAAAWPPPVKMEPPSSGRRTLVAPR